MYGSRYVIIICKFTLVELKQSLVLSLIFFCFGCSSSLFDASLSCRPPPLSFLMRGRMDEFVEEEQTAISVSESFERQCWGCALRLLLKSYSTEFKCGWCGAITIQNPDRLRRRSSHCWRRFIDGFLMLVVILFMLFIIGGGVWAVYPVVFSVSFLCGTIHALLKFLLSITNLSSYFMAALRFAGQPPSVLWGSYPVIGKDSLENYTFCIYCERPKSPRAHHCRSCGTCVLDMDHHCPFIGNCVGAANHRVFVAFLISAIISATYTMGMCVYANNQLWPSITNGSLDPLFNSGSGFLRLLNDIRRAFLSSALLLSTRGIILVYLFIASFSIQIGLIVLLAQQLKFVYEGQTYISYLSSSGGENGEAGVLNLMNFFGCPYSVSKFVVPDARKKSHEK